VRGAFVALARVAIRQREHLAMLRPDESVLVVHLLHWPATVRDPHDFAPPPGTTTRPEENQMARTLIDSLSGHYHPEDYRDRYKRMVWGSNPYGRASGRDSLKPL
jgi:DNA end-binding protein Ku